MDEFVQRKFYICNVKKYIYVNIKAVANVIFKT